MSRRFRHRGRDLDWAGLVGALPDRELARPTRSTVPLIAWWRDHDVPGLVDGAVHALEVEATVASTTFPRADGRPHRNTPSYTDLMATGPDRAVAVEGKWTEPAYATVDAWLAESPGPNREGVVARWLGLLGPYVGTVDRGALGACTYQLLHRSASACAQGRRDAWVVYQVFDPSHADRYLGALRQLRRAVSPTRLRLAVLAVPTTPTPAWRALAGAPPGRVRAGLLAGELFTFGPARLIEA